MTPDLAIRTRRLTQTGVVLVARVILAMALTLYSAITTTRKATEDIPPAEAEANYYRQLNSQAAMAA
ncbi:MULTISPECIES: hypothetical protein [Marinobacter]|uniref:hypothetical protein n=1 Tax=Marinobacter TaxID=2742 RepID=UPI0011AAD5B0|nr:hypothetical protein [Marinobacter maritimus]|tara:strand:- start:1155 stop:1355 length:201 start_codon:yes stop_codon:yes gene_type:complete